MIPTVCVALLLALAGPPLPVATLGQAKLICPDRSRIFATADGQHAITQRGEWFDLVAGKRIDPPFPRPDGGTVHSVLDDGTVVVEAAKQLHFFPPGAKKPKSTLDTHGRRVWLAAGGSAAVSVQGWTDDTVSLLLADLSGDKRGGWKTVADDLPPVLRVGVGADGTHAAVLFEGAGDVAVYDLRAKTAVNFPQAQRKPPPPGVFVCGAVIERSDVALSANGDFLYIAHGLGITAHNAATREPLAGDSFTASERGLTPARATVARRFETLTGRSAYVGNGSKVVRRTEGGVIRVFDTATGEQLDRHSTYPAFRGVKALDDRQAVAWTADGRLVTWDIASGKATADVGLEGTRGCLDFGDLTFSPDLSTVVVRSLLPQSLHADVKTGKKLPHDGGMHTVFTPDGERLVIDDRGALSKPGAETPLVRGVLPDDPESRLLFDPAGRLAVSVTDRGVMVFEMASGKRRWDVETPGNHGGLVLAAVVTRREVVLVREGGVVVYDLATQKLRGSFELDKAERKLATLSADGRWLAVIGFARRETFTLFPLDHPNPWGASVELPIRPTAETTALAFTPDGKRLLTSHLTGVAHAWDISAFTLPKANPREDELWESLAADDAEEAGRAMAELVQTPQAAVALLAKRLTAETEAMEPTDWTRQAREVEVLEMIGGAEAEKVLRRLAGGTKGAKLTDEAGRALKRLTPPPGRGR